MKKILFILLVAAFSFTSCKEEVKPTKQEITQNVRYQLFQTQNIWTFLKLDTQNGKIWQVQYSLDESYRGEVELNTKSLVEGGNAENGRFTLYPTQNIFNFILLDQQNGKMWQVQWNNEAANRGIVPIK